MWTVCADEASTDYGAHVAVNTLVIIVRRQSISQQWQLNAVKAMFSTQYAL